MSNTITRDLNQYLGALFDVEDPIYRSFISNSDGIPELTITNPFDYNIGAVANMLEWNRQLGISLVKQLDLTKASGKFLEFIAQELIGINRHAGESDTDWVLRIQAYTVAPKKSPASIIFYTRPFSTTEPVIQQTAEDGMFCDVSFADVTSRFRITTPGQEFDNLVFPALTVNTSDSAYFFVLLLTGTLAADIPNLLELMNRWVAAGIDYEIRILS